MNPERHLTGFEIAIIGMAGRFPGAKNILEFWDNLKNGREAVFFFSDEELLKAGVEPEILDNPDYVKANFVLDGIEYFDAPFFGYTDTEAAIMDPQIRIFHESAWACLEDAGYCPSGYSGLIGLYVGASANFDWEARCLFTNSANTLGMTSAQLLMDKDFLAGWVSYKLDLKGPSYTLTTACSTSLVAVHEACQAILNGECDIALAGGVCINQFSKRGYLRNEGEPISSDGHVRAFDAGPHGIAGGNGSVVVAIKRLEEVLNDGDHMYAVIKGSAINNDGINKAGFTTPSIEGQARVISAALDMAEIESESIGYIETHGTATELGDPVEIRGLKMAYNTHKRQYCRIGSVKTNIGHLDAAAGVAGLVKAALSIKYRLIFPSLHFQVPNPNIDFTNSPFLVNSELMEWENKKYPLRAGVSSFGLGGTNAHVILEEAPPGRRCTPDRPFQLILLSARTRQALNRNIDELALFLKTHPGINIADAAYTLIVGRKHHQYRRSLVVKNNEEAIQTLSGTEKDNEQVRKVPEYKPNVVFMFSGQGVLYLNMGLDLYNHHSQFRDEIDRNLSVLASISNSKDSDLEFKTMLYPSNNDSGTARKLLNNPLYHGAVTLIFEYSMAKLLMNWGLKPDALIGYSFGEYTAACLAGVFSLEDVLKLALRRGEMIQRMPVGSMMSVPLGEDEIKRRLPKDISLAAVNGPEFCIVSGPPESIKKFRDELRKEGHDAYRFRVQRAAHSEMMVPYKNECMSHFQDIRMDIPIIPYISSLTGDWVTRQQAVSPRYWARQMAETVRFRDGIDRLMQEINPIFIQVSSERALPLYAEMHPGKKETIRAMNLVRYEKDKENDLFFLLSRIGELWQFGVNIDWRSFYKNENRARIPLPGYSFERRHYAVPSDIKKTIIDIMAGKSGAALHLTSPQDEPVVYVNEEEEDGPATTNRKKKRQKVNLSVPYCPPRNQKEQKLVELFESFFGIEPVGIHDNFYELGGDSLRAVQLIGLIKKSDLQMKLPIKDLLYYQNIHNICAGMRTDDNNAMGKNSETLESYLSEKYSTSVHTGHYKTNGTTYKILSIDGEPFEIHRLTEDIFGAITSKRLTNIEYPNYIAFTGGGHPAFPNEDEIDEELINRILKLKKRVVKKDLLAMEAEINRKDQLAELLKKNRVKRDYEVSPIQATFLFMEHDYVANEFAFYINEFPFSGRPDEVRELVKKIIRRNSLFRSTIVRDKNSFFVREYESFDNILIPVLDLSNYSITCKESIIDRLASRFNRPMEIFDHPLYHMVIVKTDHFHWRLILQINHLIGDGTCVGILDEQLKYLSHGKKTSEDKVPPATDYFEYINFLKNQDYENIELEQYLDLRQFIHTIKSIKKSFQVTSTKMVSMSLEIGSLQSSHQDYYNEISLLTFGRLIGELFSLDRVPIVYVASGRSYKDANFAHIIGDFHDNIPILIELDQKPLLTIKKIIRYKNYIRQNNLNFSNYFFRKMKNDVNYNEFSSPFNFNSLFGSYEFFKSPNEERRLKSRQLRNPHFSMLILEDFLTDKIWVSFLHNSGFDVKEKFLQHYYRLMESLGKKE